MLVNVVLNICMATLFLLTNGQHHEHLQCITQIVRILHYCIEIYHTNCPKFKLFYPNESQVLKKPLHKGTKTESQVLKKPLHKGTKTDI
jgi:hypothetical protein